MRIDKWIRENLDQLLINYSKHWKFCEGCSHKRDIKLKLYRKQSITSGGHISEKAKHFLKQLITETLNRKAEEMLRNKLEVIRKKQVKKMKYVAGHSL